MIDLISQIIGVVGALITVIVSYLTSHGIYLSTDKKILVTKLIGCILLFVSLVHSFNAGSLIINTVVAMIYIKALIYNHYVRK